MFAVLKAASTVVSIADSAVGVNAAICEACSAMVWFEVRRIDCSAVNALIWAGFRASIWLEVKTTTWSWVKAAIWVAPNPLMLAVLKSATFWVLIADTAEALRADNCTAFSALNCMEVNTAA